MATTTFRERGQTPARDTFGKFTLLHIQVMEYFHTPQFLSTTLHFITFFEVLVHLFGTYCILFRTPESMRSVKLSMFNLHVWSSLLDLSVSLGATPFVLFPAIAGYPLGVLKEFGMSTAAQIYLVVLLFATVGVAVFSVFENRFFLLFAENSWWRHARLPILTVNYLMAFFFFIPPYLYIPDQHFALQQIYTRFLPVNLPDYIRHGPVFVLAIDITYSFTSVALVTIIIITEIVIVMLLLKWNMWKRRKTMSLSQKTEDLQRKFIKAVHVQIYMPLGVLILPLIWFATSIFFSLYNQALNNICFVTIAFHGLTSTLIMLFIHKPYRDVISEMFSMHKLSNRTSPIQVSRRDSEFRTAWHTGI